MNNEKKSLRKDVSFQSLSVTTNAKAEELPEQIDRQTVQQLIQQAYEQGKSDGQAHTAKELATLTQLLQQSQQREETLLTELSELSQMLKQSKHREVEMINEQQKSTKLLESIQKNTLWSSVLTILLEFVKDVGKNAVNGLVHEVAKVVYTTYPSLQPYGDWFQSLPSIVKTAAIAVAAVFVLNHTGTVFQGLRSGLVKLKSLFASK